MYRGSGRLSVMARHDALGDINNLQCGVQRSGFPCERSPVNLCVYTFSERASDVMANSPDSRLFRRGY